VVEGEEVVVRAGDGGAARLTLDDSGRLLAVVDPLRGRTTYAYDPHGRLTRISLPDGRCQTLSYDGGNRRMTSRGLEQCGP
jgi:YD repeat-containing protein